LKSRRLACLLCALALTGCYGDVQVNSPAAGSAAAATLSWMAPTTNTDGTALTDLAGYRIYYGMSPSDLSESIAITTTGIQTYVVEGLGPGTWYFAVVAVTTDGAESALSTVVSKLIG